MRVLVTGASGFIGSHVCEALSAEGHQVIGLDMVPQYPMRCIEWVTADISQPLTPIRGLDAVVHLAALAAPRDCDRDPARAFAINVNGTHQVLKMATASRVGKVVFASSAHVYDIPPRYLPTDETHPLRLNNTYTTTKILGEQLCQLYFENHGLSYTVLRLYNAYGPGQAPGYFIPDMLAKAEKGAVELQGADTTKDWVHIDDVADAFVKAVASSFVGPVNIGTGIETSLRTIAQQIALSYQVDYKAEHGGSASRMCADWRRAKSVLGWQPMTKLSEGLTALLRQPVEAGATW